MGIQYFSLPEKVRQHLLQPNDVKPLRKLFVWDRGEDLSTLFRYLYEIVAHNTALRNAFDNRNIYDADWAWDVAGRLYEQLHTDLQQIQAILTSYSREYELTTFALWGRDAGIPFYELDVQANMNKYLYIKEWMLCLPSTRRLLASGQSQHECYIQTMANPATCGVSRIQHLELGIWEWELYAWEDHQDNDKSEDIPNDELSAEDPITLNDEVPLDVFEEDLEAATKAMARLQLEGCVKTSTYTAFRQPVDADTRLGIDPHETAIQERTPGPDDLVIPSIEPPETEPLRRYDLRSWRKW